MTKISTQPLENIKTAFKKEVQFGNSKLSFTFLKYAPRADVAILGQMGGTSVLVTVVSSKKESDLDYFPLQVEYIERLYAGGKIKGSRFVKREGRPTDDAILVARMIDRSIRPLFPKGFRHDVQVIATAMSVNSQNDPAILANITTQIALYISSIPWQGPSLAARIGHLDGQLIFNPSLDEIKNGDLDLIISATKDAVVMIEAGAKEVENKVIVDGVKLFYEQIQPLFELVENLKKEIGKEKQEYQAFELDAQAVELAQKKEKEIAEFILKMSKVEKNEDDWQALKEKWLAEAKDQLEEGVLPDYDQALTEVFAEEARKHLLATGQRLDGRSEDEVRPLEIEVGLLPEVHGSALFQRGQTQVLSVLTLGSPAMEQIVETMLDDEFKRYIHHYSALPYSVGETGRVGWPRRREIGHGALAEKALLPVLPSEDEFPYTIRIVSEVLSQQGSTSMASTCGSTLSLMDAGVPIKSPVAGISIGMVSDEKNNYRLLTDIKGIEDHTGDMDFKVTGTAKGITAIQLDVKKMILNVKIIEETLARAQQTRLAILAKMKEIIDSPRQELAPTAPKIGITHVPVDKIGEVIGSGGQNIKRISKETETIIDIKEDGRVTVTGKEKADVESALKIIDDLVRDFTVGEEFTGKVVRLTNFGAFIELVPGRDALLHISKIPGYVQDINKVLTDGQELKVKVDAVNPDGKISVTLAQPIPGYKPQERRQGGFNRRNNFRPRR